MATRTDDWPDDLGPDRSTYPWREWFDGGVWTITQGEDFQSGIDTMRSYILGQGHARGGRARTRVRGKTITFQFIKEDQP